MSQQTISSNLNKRSNLTLFSPESSSIKDFLTNIETNIIPHGHEKAFKQALYNGLALLLLSVCTCICYAVYLILQPFLKPLLWALICGTVLFPTKKIISCHLKHYVKSMQSHSMLLQTVYVPVLMVDSASDIIGIRVQYMCNLKYTFQVLGGGLSLLFIYFYTPSILSLTVHIFSTLFSLIYSFIALVQHFSVILLLCIAYASLVYTTPSQSNAGSIAQNSCYLPYLKNFSLLVWFSLSCYMCSWFGSLLQSVLLILVQFLFLAGCLYEWYSGGVEETDANLTEDGDTVNDSVFSLQSQKLTSPPCSSEKILSPPSSSHSRQKLTKRSQSDPFLLDKICPASSPLSYSTEYSAVSPSDTHTSDTYIYWVLCFCALAAVLQNLYLLIIVILFELVYLVKKMCLKFGLNDTMQSHFNTLKSRVQHEFDERREVLFPAPLDNIRKINLAWRHWCLSLFRECPDAIASTLVILGLIFLLIFASLFSDQSSLATLINLAWRHWCLSLFRECSDAIASTLVILGLIFLLIFASLFFLIQAYGETFHMVKLTGSLINSTLVHNPEVMQYLPEDWEGKMDVLLNSTYTYGRAGISSVVSSMLRGVKKEKVAEFESTVLELWDRIYQAWLMSVVESDKIGPKVSTTAVTESWSSFLEHIHKTPELMNIKTLSVLVNNNMAMLSSGLESVWLLLKANMGLAIQAFTTLVSLVFESGFAVFNFFINMVVFLTALFYLLSSSGKLYKPVQIITSVSPVYGNKLAVAIETAVHEVLTASFKLALFYFLWTWLIHSLFQVRLVYIPSAIASILAAIPILGPYWACIPGVLDLYLAQDNGLKALLLLLFQVLPTFFVDTAIFNEIQGGHPYLTGLSVAGGVFWLGMEGAIIGPLLLCCLFVIVNMSTAIMRDTALPTPSVS